MENLGDVDVQALAGAIATGTHGTGSRLRSLSNQVVGLRLYTAERRPARVLARRALRASSRPRASRSARSG